MIDVGKQSLRVAIQRLTERLSPAAVVQRHWREPRARKTVHASANAHRSHSVRCPRHWPVPATRHSLSTIDAGPSRLAASGQMGYRRAEIGGVAWGGGIAQQFAHQHYDMCRKIVLAATSPGALMISGDPRVLWKLATPRRYIDKDFMRRVAPEIYGGAFRNNPDILAAYAKAMTGASEKGYLYQLIAMTGWTSLPWLWALKQPALILAGRDDPIVPPVNARLMARLMPNARTQAPRRRSPVSRHQSRRVGCDHRGVSRRMKESEDMRHRRARSSRGTAALRFRRSPSRSASAGHAPIARASRLNRDVAGA